MMVDADATIAGVCECIHFRSLHITSLHETKRNTMHADAPDHVIMRSLAQEIARGGDVERWAKLRAVSLEVAREWTELPEFREFVEKCRIEHCERLVGKIGCCAERAIERLVELSENRKNLSVALAASKAIIEKWIALTEHFVQERTYQSLTARMKVLMDARKAEKQFGVGRRW